MKRKELRIEANFKLTAKERDGILDIFEKRRRGVVVSYPDIPNKREIKEDKRLNG